MPGAAVERGGFDAVETRSELRLRLLGHLDLSRGGERLPALESARARSLLAHLVLGAGTPHPRQRLAFMLWPDSTEAQAMTNLRKALHTLRREAPDVDRFLDVTARHLRWRDGDGCWVDVAAFEAALARAAAGQGSAALREAVDLYRGDLLEDTYDEWVVEERGRLRDLYLSAARRLSEELTRAGDHAEAVRVGRDALRRDPLSEDTYRLLMRIHDAAGDRAGAARVYHECVSTLRRELGVEPSAATVEAYGTLLAAATAPSADAVTGAALVGRDREWQELTALWSAAEAGRARLAVVTGEAGVGKTRLVEELAAWCAHRGAVVATSRSYPTEGEIAYGVAISWLRGALAAHVERAVQPDRSALAGLLPELDAGPAAVADTGDEAYLRRRVFEAVAGVVAAVGRPVLLVADDAQWCDTQSLQLVHYLARLDTGLPLLVVATARREELYDGGGLSALVDALGALDRTAEIELARFGPLETQALARQLAARPLDDATLEALHAGTEGNPLFIVETIRSGREPTEVGSALSPKLQAVISGRLKQVSVPARAVLDLAATIGRAFATDLVGAAAELDDLSLARALDELWRRGIIREQDVDGYDFSHGKIRDVAYAGLSPAARRRNHVLVAEALQRADLADGGALSGQVAFHYDRGARTAEAYTWYLRAAVHAQRIHANTEAVRLLDRAAELVTSLPEPTRPRRELEVLSALATPLAMADGFGSQRLIEVQRRALEVARAVRAEPDPALLRSAVLSTLCRDDFPGARRFAADLRAMAERSGDAGLLVESEYLLGIAGFWGGDLPAARSWFESVAARPRAEHVGDHVLRFGHDPWVVCASRLANTLWFLGDEPGARAARDAALEMAVRSTSPYSRSVALVFAALLAVDLDDGDDVARHAAALVELGARALPTDIKAEALGGLAEVYAGRYREGVARIHQAIERCGPVNHAPGFRAALARVHVAAHAVGGDAVDGLDAVDTGLALGGTPLWAPELRRQRARFLAAAGSAETEVRAELHAAASAADRYGAAGPGRLVERTRSDLGLAG